MRTVPAGAAATLLATRADLRAALRPCGRIVGARAEVDLDAASAAIGAPAAELLEAYMRRCQTLWRSLEDQRPGPEWIAVRRGLMSHQQVTGKKGRADLVEVFDALGDLPGVAELLEEVTAASPDLTAAAAIAGALGGTITGTGDTLRADVSLEGAYPYPAVLGGPAWPGEVRRVLTVTTRHAAWRDRRVRRLAKVDVAVDELWAAPGDLADLVTALPTPSPVADGPTSDGCGAGYCAGPGCRHVQEPPTPRST